MGQLACVEEVLYKLDYPGLHYLPTVRIEMAWDPSGPGDLRGAIAFKTLCISSSVGIAKRSKCSSSETTLRKSSLIRRCGPSDGPKKSSAHLDRIGLGDVVQN